MAQRTRRPVEYRVAAARAETDLESGAFEGYAATFWSVDSYGTAFAPKAFRKTLAERGERVPLLLQHNPDWNIGVPTTMREDAAGLFQQSRLFDDGGTTVGTGSVALRQLRQGARYGMSFGFNTMRDRAATPDDPLDMGQMDGMTRDDVRIITEVRLWEISLVTFPANEQAGVTGVRTMTDEKPLAFAPGLLAELLDALRSGTLDAETAGALSEIMAAWREAEPIGSVFAVQSPTPPPMADTAAAVVADDVRETDGLETVVSATDVDNTEQPQVDAETTEQTEADHVAVVDDSTDAADVEAEVEAEPVAEVEAVVAEAEVVATVRNRRAELDWAAVVAAVGRK